MNSKRLLKHLVTLMFFIFLANTLALKLNLYSLVWYLDIIMHTLGGMWVGMFFLYVFNRRNPTSLNFKIVVQTLVTTLAIGLLWEIYEFYVYQYLSHITFDMQDTSSDIFFDLLGYSMACFYFSKFIMIDVRNRLQ